MLAFCAVACLHSGRLSLRAQIAAPLLVILLLLAATAGVALRLDLPGTAVAYYTLPALACLVRLAATVTRVGQTGTRRAAPLPGRHAATDRPSPPSFLPTNQRPLPFPSPHN